jgi:hypothetical protein
VAAEQVETFSLDIWRWTRVERAARPLADVAERAMPLVGGRSFTKTAAYRDAYSLLSRASTDPEREPPITETGADGTQTGNTDMLVSHLEWELPLLMRSASIWKRRAALEQAGRPAAASTSVDGLWRGDPGYADRTAAQRDTLAAALKGADRRLAELDAVSWHEAPGSWSREALAEDVPHEVAVPGLRERLRGWLRRRLQFTVASMAGLEAVITLIGIAVPCAVYMLTLYTPTWGADADLLTAFAAGFAGKVVIDWSGLAVFRPIWGWWRDRRTERTPPVRPTPPETPADDATLGTPAGSPT